jgi:surface protein
MNSMFQECNELEYLDLSNFNTKNITDFSFMFNKCYKLKQIKGINNFKTDKSETMNKMFAECNKLDLTKLSHSDFKDKKIINQLSEDIDSNLMPKNGKKSEKKSLVMFKSEEKYINFPVRFNDEDMFSEIEDELYLKYPELEEEDISFLINGKKINKTSTIGENGIKNGDIILIKEEEIDSLFN